MLTNWRDIAPYVRTANDSHGEPIGMMPHIIHTAVYECCEECPSHTTGRIRVNYTHDGYGNPANKSEDIIIKTYIDDKTDIHFPIYGFHDQTHFSKYYAYIPIVPSAGVAFFVNKQGGKASPQNVTAAVFSCWPLIMLNLIMAFLVGLIVWLLVSALSNSVNLGEGNVGEARAKKRSLVRELTTSTIRRPFWKGADIKRFTK